MKLVDIEKAKELLLTGDVVAIPTETVYGLGGWIYSKEGLEKIFATKERPFFDPLIVHVDTLEKAKSLTSEWTEIHDILAKNCWPGPLTLIAKKNEKVSHLITAGLDSVGLRCPNHPVTLKLLEKIEGGIAAPSANKFGKTSPTTAQHVFKEFENSVAILEGGASEIGIESTVVGIQNGRVEIFRPGHFTPSKLTKILNDHGIKAEVVYAESPVAPGQLKHHYMPKIPLIIVPQGFIPEKNNHLIEIPFKNPVLWHQPSSSIMASRELYQKMREFDEKGYDIIFAEKLPIHSDEEWIGIWNRLEKAKTKSLESKNA